MLVLTCALVTVAPTNPLQYFKPQVDDSDLEKLKAQVAAMKAAQEGLTKGALLPQEEAEAEEGDDGLLGSATATATAAATTVASRSLFRKLITLRPLPLAITVAGGVAFFGYRHATIQRLASEVDAELSAIAELARSSKRAQGPVVSRGSIPSHRAALAELRRRKALLSDHVLPLLTQLDQAVEGASKRPLVQRSASELEELNATLTRRVALCGRVLEQYEMLGQPPPPDFRSWPGERLEARLTNLTAKAPELKKINGLLSQLGRQRMDWAFAEWSVDALREHAAQLVEQVAEAAERKAKAKLQGQVEAELWRRNEEVPVALATLGCDELRALLTKLQKGEA